MTAVNAAFFSGWTSLSRYSSGWPPLTPLFFWQNAVKAAGFFQFNAVNAAIFPVNFGIFLVKRSQLHYFSR